MTKLALLGSAIGYFPRQPRHDQIILSQQLGRRQRPLMEHGLFDDFLSNPRPEWFEDRLDLFDRPFLALFR